jgi:drug/metabolite transporter (DMT)-like permease
MSEILIWSKTIWDHARAGCLTIWDSGTICSLLSALMFSLNSLLVKLAYRIPSTEIVFVRSIMSLGLCLAFASRTRLFKDRLIYGHARLMHLLACRGLFGATAMQCQYVAIQNLPLGDAVTLFFLNPALTALAAFLLLRERLSWMGWMGVAVSLGGLLLLTHPPFIFGQGDQWDHRKIWGTAAGCSSAVFAAAAFITIRIISTREPAIVLSMWFHTTAMVSSVPCLAFSWPGPPAVWPSIVEWVILTAIGISSFAGQMVLSRGFQLLSGAKASGINMTQLVFGWFFGFVFFNEELTALSIGGSGLVAVGAIMVNLKQQQQRDSRRGEENRATESSAPTETAPGPFSLQKSTTSASVPPSLTTSASNQMAIQTDAFATKDQERGKEPTLTATQMREEETQSLLSRTQSKE